MRDAGLNCAIDAAAGVAQLARKSGIAKPSVSNWDRVLSDVRLPSKLRPAYRASNFVPISIASWL